MAENERKDDPALRIWTDDLRWTLDPINDLNAICQRIRREWAFEMTCKNPRTNVAQHLAICRSKCTCTLVMVTSLTYSAVNDVEYGRGCGRNINRRKMRLLAMPYKLWDKNFPVKDRAAQRCCREMWFRAFAVHFFVRNIWLSSFLNFISA